MQQAIWNLIRETRSARPGKAHDDAARAAVYGSALQQFEELMRAAAAVGYASSPLPLFYAVSQAGRAIAAAWADDPWRPTSHGLKHQLAGSPLRSTVRPDPVAKPGKIDSFSCICAATGQGKLTDRVELGALWASLPDLRGQELRDERWRRPLAVTRPAEDPRTAALMRSLVQATIRGVPDGAFEGKSDQERDQALEAELSHYPSTEGWRPLRPQGLRLERPGHDGWDVEVIWEAESASIGARDLEFESHAFQHRIRREWWLRPDVNESGDYLWPLMTWWALSYGLSMLARYHPAEWTSALRVDESPETVPLEAALDAALDAVPHFVLEALYGQQFTVPG
jgi:hypothetical protein